MHTRNIHTERLNIPAMIANLSVGVLLVDPDGQVVMMNAAARQILGEGEGLTAYGYTIDNKGDGRGGGKAPRFLNLQGKPIPPHDLPLPRALEKREAVHNEKIILRRGSGDDRLLLVDCSPIDDDEGRVTGAIAVLSDVTDRVQAEEQAQADASREKLLASLSRSFVEAVYDASGISQNISRLIATATQSRCLILLVTEDGDYLKVAGWYADDLKLDETAARALLQSAVFPIHEGVEGQALQSQKAVLLDSVEGDALDRFSDPLRALLKNQAASSLLITPLVLSGRALGTLTAWRSSGEKPFSPEDQAFFSDLAERGALAIENARLYADEVQRNRELNALHDATAALLSTLDLEVLLGRIVDSAQRALPAAERAVLFLMAPRTGKLEVRAMLGFNDPRIRRAGLLQNGRVDRAIRERRPLLINDTQNDLGPEGLLEQELSLVGSAILAPLFLGNEVLGCLALMSSVPHAFSQADLRLLVSFAATTTAALHNAMLHAEVQKLAITDTLTGLYNRRGLEELGKHELDRFHRFGHPLSVVMLDIDHFKDTNDRYGHAAGDQVLRGVAERCRVIIRQVDLIGRYGGEEFVVLLPETDLFQAVNIAERLRRAVAETPFVIEQGVVSITVSLGVSRAGRNTGSLAQLFELADAALYGAKLKGRNRVEIG